jgi:DNA-binding Lrp family transcriptional regulator
MTSMTDQLDADLLTLLHDEPRVGMLEASRRLGVARGTVQARIDRLEKAGVVTGYGPDLDPAALGFGVTAYTTLEIRQGAGRSQISQRLQGIPEVLEAHTISGNGDFLCKLVARDNADLQRVIDEVVSGQDIVRTSTVIVLTTEVAARTMSLLGAPSRRHVSRAGRGGRPAG